MTAGRGWLYGEVGHTCFQTSNLRAVVVVRVSECILHPKCAGSGGRWREGFEKPLWGRKNCLACVHCTLRKRALGICECCCESMCAARDTGAMCVAKRRAGALDSAGVDDRVSVRDEVATHRDERHVPPPSRVQTTENYTGLTCTRGTGMKR